MDIYPLIATFIVGIIASIIGAMVGSAGLISIPFLIFIGLPPQVAIVTHKWGAIGLKIGSFVKYYKTNHIKWIYFLPLSILGFVAAFIGTRILLIIDKEMLSYIVAMLLLLIVPLIFIKKDLGIINQETSSTKKYIGYFLFFLAQIFGAFFGGGAATFVMYILISFFGLNIIDANATATLPALIMNLTAVIILALNGIFDLEFGIAIFAGMMVGGWIGAHIAILKGSAWVKGLFAVIVILSALKLLLD